MKTMAELEQILESQKAEYLKALTASDVRGMDAAEESMKETEKEYAAASKAEVFRKCRMDEHPLLAILKQYAYPVKIHHVVKQEGVTCDCEIRNSERGIDLLEFAKFCEKPHTWEYAVEKFGNLLCMRVAHDLGYTDKQVKEVEGLYYMSSLSKKKDMGAAPTSNAQVCKLMQACINEIFTEFGENAEGYKCNNRDVAWLTLCYGKRSNKARLTLSVAKTNFVRSILMDVLYRLAVNGVYTVDFKKAKDAEVPAEGKKPPVASKVSEPETVQLERPEAPAAEVSDAPSSDLPAMDEIPEGAVA